MFPAVHSFTVPCANACHNSASREQRRSLSMAEMVSASAYKLRLDSQKVLPFDLHVIMSHKTPLFDSGEITSHFVTTHVVSATLYIKDEPEHVSGSMHCFISL